MCRRGTTCDQEEEELHNSRAYGNDDDALDTAGTAGGDEEGGLELAKKVQRQHIFRHTHTHRGAFLALLSPLAETGGGR